MMNKEFKPTLGDKILVSNDGKTWKERIFAAFWYDEYLCIYQGGDGGGDVQDEECSIEYDDWGDPLIAATGWKYAKPLKT